jgi:hypothetical protein
MLEILLSKKFIFALIAIVMGFVLVLMKETTSDIFFKFVEIVGGLYVIGNGVDKVSDTVLEK